MAEQDVYDSITRHDFAHDEKSAEHERLRNKPHGDQLKGLLGLNDNLPPIEKIGYHVCGRWLTRAEIEKFINDNKPTRLEPTAAVYTEFMEDLTTKQKKNPKKKTVLYHFASSHGLISKGNQVVVTNRFNLA